MSDHVYSVKTKTDFLDRHALICSDLLYCFSRLGLRPLGGSDEPNEPPWIRPCSDVVHSDVSDILIHIKQTCQVIDGGAYEARRQKYTLYYYNIRSVISSLK